MQNAKQFIRKLAVFLTLAFLTTTLVISCSSEPNITPNPNASNITPNPNPSSIPSQSPSSQPQPSTSFQPQCSVNISNVLDNLAATNHIIDPLVLRNALLAPLQDAKSAWQQISTDNNCNTEKEQLRLNIQAHWQRYLNADYNTGQILANSNKLVCTSGCNLFSDGADTCKEQCDRSYERELERLARQRDLGSQEMTDFFN